MQSKAVPKTEYGKRRSLLKNPSRLSGTKGSKDGNIPAFDLYFAVQTNICRRRPDEDLV